MYRIYGAVGSYSAGVYRSHANYVQVSK